MSKKYRIPRIIKECPVCESNFETFVGNHPRAKTTCSHACANTYFRSGKNNPNWKDSAYRTTCFLHHSKRCVVCGESRIVEVHHLDHDITNNDPTNLIPLCPTHHRYWHSRYKPLIESVVQSYIQGFNLAYEGTY